MESVAEVRELSFHEEDGLVGAGALLHYINYVGSYTAGCTVIGVGGGAATGAAFAGVGAVPGSVIGGAAGALVGIIWGSYNYFNR